MTISKKISFLPAIIGIVLIFFGVWLIANSMRDEVILKAIALLILLFGIGTFINFLSYYQASSFQLDIKDNYLIFDGKTYQLEQSKITVEFPSKAPVTKVTLRIEKGHQTQTVFENLILYDYELETLIQLLKPYLKHQEIIEKITQNSDTIILLDNGFALDNRVIDYDEVERITTTLVDVNGTHFLDFTITLKNGETIDKRLKGGSDEYAKAIFTELKHKGAVSIDCKEQKNNDAVKIKPEFVPYLFIFSYLISAIITFFDHNFIIVMMVLFVFHLFYLMTDSSYETKLCKKVKALFNQHSKASTTCA